MDGQHFDRITRSWATRTNRRQALRFVGLGFLITWWERAKTQVAAQETPASISCTQDAECLDEDVDPCTGAGCVNGHCAYFIVNCIAGHVCCGNGACCSSGETAGCLADTDCMPMSDNPCEGARCEGGTCVPFLTACAPGFNCCGNGVCCSAGNGCVVDLDCPTLAGGLGTKTRCVSGVCVPA